MMRHHGAYELGGDDRASAYRKDDDEAMCPRDVL